MRFRYIRNATAGVAVPDLPTFTTQRTISKQLATLSYFRTLWPRVNEDPARFHRSSDDLPAGDFEFPGLDSFPTSRSSRISTSRSARPLALPSGGCRTPTGRKARSG